MCIVYHEILCSWIFTVLAKATSFVFFSKTSTLKFDIINIKFNSNQKLLDSIKLRKVEKDKDNEWNKKVSSGKAIEMVRPKW